MPVVKYICEGTCGTAVSEEEFNDSRHVCNSDGCSRIGQPLVRKLVCEKCGTAYNEGESHMCDF